MSASMTPRVPHEMRCGRSTFRWGSRTYVMGVVNVTPDSFSGDGLAHDVNAALELAGRMEADGADIIDLGAESTRPAGRVYGIGAQAISAEEELARLMPVLCEVVKRVRVPVSVDTYKAEVAQKALEAGAAMINSVWAGESSPELAEVVAQYGVPIVLMHNQRGHQYDDLLPDVMRWLQLNAEEAIASGVAMDRIIVDPGIGFGKTPDQNLEVLGCLSAFRSMGFPVLVGPSRKSTIGQVLGLPVEERLEGTAAAVSLSIAGGADIVRVHDVREMVRVARMSDAIVRGWRPENWDG